MPTTPPVSAVNTMLDMETKKTWEKHLQLIPVIRPSHCLSIEISNSASPRRWVLYIMYAAGLVDLQAYGYNTPCADALLRNLLMDQVCEV